MQVTIVKIGITNKDKEGNDLKDKNGKHYHKAYIKCKEYGDRYVNKGYCKEKDVETIRAWKEGDIVELEIGEREWNGKKYLDFDFPSKNVSRQEFDELVKRVAVLESSLITNIKDDFIFGEPEDKPPF
jgi:hypothetical protein